MLRPKNLNKSPAMFQSRVTAEPRGSVLLLADFTGAKIDKKSLREH